MAAISDRPECRQIDAANGSSTTPVVFIAGLWLSASRLPTGEDEQHRRVLRIGELQDESEFLTLQAIVS